MADQGIAAIPHHASTVAINSYLRDGITWTRFQTLAVLPRSEGGLAFFGAGGAAFQAFFGQAPIQLIEDRPECYDLFLAWLVPRSGKLRRLAELDLEQRRLTLPAAGVALSSLQNRGHWLRRVVESVLVHKALYLWFKIQKDH